MIRTVHDLVDAIRPDEEPAGPAEPADFWAGVWRRRQRARRRRALATAAGVALAVGLTVGVPVTLSRAGGGLAGAPASPSGPVVTPPVGPSQPPAPTATAGPTPTSRPAPRRPALSLTMRESAVGAWRIVPYATMPQVQFANVLRAGYPKSGGGIEVYEPGAYDPTPMLGGTPTTVHGRPAYYGVTPIAFSGDEQGRHVSIDRQLVWEYAPGAWAAVHGTFGEASAPPGGGVPPTLRRIAEGVAIGPAQTVRLPMLLGYVPAGLTPVWAVLGASGMNAGVEFDHVVGAHDWHDPYRWEYAPLRVLVGDPVPRDWHPDTTLGGLPAMRNGPNDIIVQRDGVWLTIANGIKLEPLSRAELERIYASITLAAWKAPSSWFDAPQGVGG